MRTVAYTVVALIAFAANSLLCRIALRDGAIDPATFSTVRLVAGAVALWALTLPGRADAPGARGSWASGAMLFLYAVPFSFAYMQLTVGTGALILFGSVQLTMVLAGLIEGERPHRLQWLGLAAALVGLLYLLRPGLAAPAPSGAALMALAGAAWAMYSLLGRGATRPLEQTAGNFARAVPLALFVSVAATPAFHIQPRGLLLAVASGALASGLGYMVWYFALRGLTATRAAVVQLAVPVLAAVGGALVLGEAISVRLMLSAAMVLGGIALALVGRETIVHNSRAAAVEPRVFAFWRNR